MSEVSHSTAAPVQQNSEYIFNFYGSDRLDVCDNFSYDSCDFHMVLYYFYNFSGTLKNVVGNSWPFFDNILYF